MQKTALILIQQQITQRVEECMELACKGLQRQFAMPTIKFNQRGKIAGSARLHLNELRFNPVLLMDNVEHFLSDVVPHEICHLISFQLFGRVRPHGKEWQALMVELYGIKPHPYHAMDVSKVTGKKFSYRCSCGPVELSIRRHNKVVRKQQQYRCLKCGTQLVAAY
ncbi:SprT family zinc-dependent metalloprotease [Flavobacterium sp. W21_SRS_FM6]|uniref:SprT family zinc-dependent metalloprotease n=1 Tax=Flavobacterium sp. W21_SRS_FM6 TaxID=3240268 RepID=UPI003F917419